MNIPSTNLRSQCRAGLAWLAALAALVGLLPAALLAQEPPPDPVVSAREGLSEGDFNWYDRAKDDLKRIEVKPPPSAPTSNSAAGASQLGMALTEGLTLLIWGIIGLILVALVYALIRAFLNREASVAADSTGQQTVAEIDRTEALPIPIERNISDLLAAARKAYDEGNYRLAIVYLYSHELVELDKHQVIHLSKGKTNRQYLREVLRAGRKALGGVLEQTQNVFEEAFFGGHAIGPAEFEPCWAALGDFDRLVREAGR